MLRELICCVAFILCLSGIMAGFFGILKTAEKYSYYIEEKIEFWNESK